MNINNKICFRRFHFPELHFILTTIHRFLFKRSANRFKIFTLLCSLKIIILPILFPLSNAQSQNLMTNGGFEEFIDCPKNYTTLHRKELITGWHIPTSGTSDYFNRCDHSKVVSVPYNSMGVLEAFEGDGYAGVILSGDPSTGSDSRNYREYVQNELEYPLDSGITYCFKMFYAVSTFSRYSVNRLGVYFSKKRFYVDTKVLNFNPQLSIDSITPTIKKDKWYEFCATYTAQGGEQFITIGNFKKDNETLIKQFYSNPDDIKKNRIGGNIKYAYYYLDNTSLTKVDHPSYCCIKAISQPRAKFPTELNIKVGTTYILENIFFKYDKYALDIQAENTLDLLSQKLMKQPKWKIKLSGHTDSLGSEKYNQQLSLHRARAVAEYLINSGINSDRIAFYGFGESEPLSGQHLKDEESENRRVEFTIEKYD